MKRNEASGLTIFLLERLPQIATKDENIEVHILPRREHKMRFTYCLGFSLLCMTGCVTLSEKAKSVQVHSQVSNILNDCKRIGPVTATASSMLSADQAVQEAKVKIRENAADLGGDTVAILNTDVLTSVTTWDASIQGIAFKCY